MKANQRASSSLLLCITISLSWLATTDSFVVPVPSMTRQVLFSQQPPRRRGEVPFTTSPSRTRLGDGKQQNVEEEPPIARFFKALYQGLTFPFPTLRKLAMDTPDFTSSNNDKMEATNIGFSFREAIAAIVVYLTLGAVSYHSTVFRETPFSWVDALYFSVVTFTSVGYGDLTPSSALGKVFTILFGLSGISILGIAIATIGSRLAAVESSMINKARKVARKRAMGLMHTLGDIHLFKENGEKNRRGQTNRKAESDTISTESTAFVSLREEDEVPNKTTSVQLWRQTLRSLFTKSIPAFSVIILGGVAMGRLEGWSTLDSCYFAFVTAVTLGYGDFSPVTKRGRLWAIIFIPLAVAALGEVLGNVASSLQERRQEQYYESLVQQELNLDRLWAMDADHDGKVTREEYVQFMLLEMGLVSEDEMKELHSQFEKLDSDGTGYLDQDDLQMRLDIKNKTKTENYL